MNLIEQINYQYSYMPIAKLNNLKPNLLTTNHTNKHKVYELIAWNLFESWLWWNWIWKNLNWSNWDWIKL